MTIKWAVWPYANILLWLFRLVAAQTSLPSSYPHDYPGKPLGDFNPSWQNYFEVTSKLPNITFPLGRSFAGNLPVNRPGHLNDTLFFYGFERFPGSLTAPLSPANRNPWGIWLNGGPGSSSLLGLFLENGPIQIQGDYSASSNNYSWDKLADYFWIDQPVGVGFATADADGYVQDEEELGKDFMGFLCNLVKVFPSLAKRPLYLTGESYAGQYIPYILKAYFDLKDPPVNIAKIAIGDGTFTSGQVFQSAAVPTVLATYPQIIGYDQEVYTYFKEQAHLCGLDLNLTYPQDGIMVDPPLVSPAQRTITWAMNKQYSRRSLIQELDLRRSLQPCSVLDGVEQDVSRRAWKRDLSLRTNGTIDPWYGCFLFDMFIDYALNYTFPWNLTDNPSGFPFNVYDIPDALNPKINMDPSIFLNNPTVKAALHAPTSKNWTSTFPFSFGPSNNTDPSPMAINIFNALAANASAKGVGIVLFSGNDDALVSHFGTEIAIQNTTFGGIQGFTRKPSTPWKSDSGNFAGVVHQERGWTYALIYGAGHLIPRNLPNIAFQFFREFVLGNNKLGLVTSPKPGITTVIGGEDPLLAGVLRGQDEIYYGFGATQSTYVFPKATRESWKTFNTAFQPQPTEVGQS